jgi:hypothetical protein
MMAWLAPFVEYELRNAYLGKVEVYAHSVLGADRLQGQKLLSERDTASLQRLMWTAGMTGFSAHWEHGA